MLCTRCSLVSMLSHSQPFGFFLGSVGKLAACCPDTSEKAFALWGPASQGHHATSRARSQPGGFTLVGQIHGASSSSSSEVKRSEQGQRGAMGEPRGSASTESSAHSHKTPSLHLREGNTGKCIPCSVKGLWNTWSSTTPQQRWLRLLLEPLGLRP